MSERKDGVDFMKGGVMLILPYYHSGHLEGVGVNIVQLYLMQTLVLISGYFAFNSMKNSDCSYLRKRARKLLIPFSFWSILYWLLIPKIHDYLSIADRIQLMFTSVYWFFWMLFWETVILFVINYLQSKVEERVENLAKQRIILLLFMLFAYMVVYGLSKLITIQDINGNSLFNVNGIAYWMIFYFVGFLLAKWDIRMAKYKRAPVLVLILSIVMIVFFVKDVDNLSLLGILLSLAEIYIYYCLSNCIPSKVKKLFFPLATNSMYIYILHFYLRINVFSNDILNVIFISIIGVVIPLFVAKIINDMKIKKLKLLFGEE